MKQYFTNIADSVIGGDFTSHRAVVTGKNIDLKEVDTKVALEGVFGLVSSEDRQPCQLIFTLNQVADNPVLICDDRLVAQLCSLFQRGIAKITTYSGLDVITYIQQRLSSAMQRIYKRFEEEQAKIAQGEPTDLRFISSVFPLLGESTFTRKQAEKLRFALGDMYWMGERTPVVRQIHASLNAPSTGLAYDALKRTVGEYIETHKKMRHGYFSALQKVFFMSDDPAREIETLRFLDSFDAEEQRSFRHILRNLLQVHQASSACYIENDPFLQEIAVSGVSQDAKLCKVIRSFLNHNALFEEKVGLWLQCLPNRYQAYRPDLTCALRIILERFSQMNLSRSGLYDRIEDELAACEGLNRMLALRADKRTSPRKVATNIVRMAVDWNYNISNAFLCSREGRILEREYTYAWIRWIKKIQEYDEETYNGLEEYNGLVIKSTAIVDAKYTIREGVLIRESREEIAL